MIDGSGGQATGAQPWLAPGTKVAGFTIEGLVSSGSFGTVYRARRDGRLFAIKLVPIDPRSHREADALRLMRHPNVVCFHGYGFWPDEQPRFLMLALEFVEGRTLDVFVEEENPSALELVMQVLLPLALTLADVHASGVVHRDIKEANIVMREEDGQPVLVDFGAAGIEETRRLTKLLPPGTPEYRSPEALRFAREWAGEPYPSGPGDDLWALGVVLYWLLTRTLPFGERDSPGMVRAILQETPPAPHELNPRVPPPLSALCMRMLEKAPEARYAHAQALAEALAKAWGQADRSWRAPLFPGARKEKRSAPAPLREARAHTLSRGWPWAVGLVLVAATLLLVPLVDLTRHTALSLHHVTPQANSGQGVEVAGQTAEIVSSAALRRSSTPALIVREMHSEIIPMFKFRKARSLAATCLIGSACASGPQQRPPPKPAECPPGAAATHKRFGLYPGDIHPATLIPLLRGMEIVPVHEGDITAEIVGPWGSFPDKTFVSGRLFLGETRVYGRFTEARLPNGDTVPVCLQVLTVGEPGLGTPVDPGSTTTRALISSSLRVEAVNRFE